VSATLALLRVSSRSWLRAAWALSLVLSLAAPCRAQEADNAAYRQAIDDATESYSNGMFDEALASFREAHRLNPSARTWRGLGMTNFEQRRYTKAFTALRKALDDPRKPLTDEQRSEAQALLNRAANYIGSFTLHITPATATLEVDGFPVELEAGVLLLDLGEHQLVLRAKDHATRSLKLVVEGGERVTLPIVLDRLVPLVAAPTTAVLPLTPSPTQVQQLMGAAAPAVLACTPGQPGSVTAKLVVSGRSGNVLKLDIEFDDVFKRQLIPAPNLSVARLQYQYATCVFDALKGLVFPKFSSPSFSIVYPYPLKSARSQAKTAHR
jgi:hypothetical protein